MGQPDYTLMALQDSVGKTNKMLKEQKKEDVKKLTDGVMKIKLDVVSGKENGGSHNSSGKAKKITKKISLKGSDKRERKASKIQQATIGSTSRSFRPLKAADVNVGKVTGAQKPSASQGKNIQMNKRAKILSSKNINQKKASSYNKHTAEDQGASQKVTVCSSKETLYQPTDLGKTRHCHFHYSLSITKTTKKDQLDKYNLDDTSTDSSTESDGSESVTSTSSTRSATSPGSVHTTSTSRSSIDSSEDESGASGCYDESSDSSDDSEEHSFTSSSTSSEEDKRGFSSPKLNSVKKLENTKYKK